MKEHIKISDLTSLSKRMYRCGIEVQDFETKFIDSLITNAFKYTKGVKVLGNTTESWNSDIVLYLSDKQKTIFNRIKTRYENAYNDRCAYYVYRQIIEDYEIKLEQYDKDTLESFKGEKENEESKEWMKQIMFYYVQIKN